MYKAYIAKITTRPFPNADNLLLGDVKGYQVIVDKSTENNSLGIFFEQGGQLSEEFAKVHDLVARKDPDGSDAGGYFKENRKVRGLKLRGARSDGFFCPLSFLEYTGFNISSLKEGDQFDELNGHKICNKFITKATQNAAKNRSIKVHRELLTMPKHIDTGQFLREGHLIPEGAVVYQTAKLHGCVSYDTIVDTLERGKIQIGEIVTKKLPYHVKSFDQGTNEVVFTKIDNFFLKKSTNNWYELELENGTKIKITGDNPVWLPNNKCYRRVCDLIVGDVLLLDP